MGTLVGELGFLERALWAVSVCLSGLRRPKYPLRKCEPFVYNLSRLSFLTSENVGSRRKTGIKELRQTFEADLEKTPVLVLLL